MLKALELVGFKSFADKTRFEFPRGITAVVGPNGSGKSNVVDAIKWALGEQSVKSLRGKEMVDVIFNGSGSRRELNAAEVTLTFDNAGRMLAIDSPEVHITRRVYRNGEGEYLINRQPSRLRDIRELFAGTGIATEAYSVIEQGKVDVLLQSSPRERRLIFEEAAGISRFKAKKLESERRLERVEQNLVRLADIVEEVEGRLRSVRQQAGKARRYQEYTARLQELRTQIGQSDWRRMTATLQTLESELELVRGRMAESVTQAESLSLRIAELEVEISTADGAARQAELQVAEYRERIAGSEATIEHQRAHAHDLDDELGRHRRQLSALGVRAGDLEQQLRQTEELTTAAATQREQVARQLAEQERQLLELTAELDGSRGQSEQFRKSYVDEMRLASRWGNEASALAAQVAAAAGSLARDRERLAEVESQRQASLTDLELLRQREQQLSTTLEGRVQDLEIARGRLIEQRREHARQAEELNALRQRQSGLMERAAVLDDLERRLEGVEAGVKELLSRARQASDGPWRAIRGLVAETLQASVDMAPVIDAALGETAQFLVVEAGPEFYTQLERESYSFHGRVGFLRLNAPESSDSPPDLGSRPGVLGRADQFVETTPEYASLARRLLAGTWIVERLAHAVQLSREASQSSAFVTLAGEVLRPDGVVTAGPKQKTVGLVSRRSELRAVRQQIQEMETRVIQAAAKVDQASNQIEDQESRLQSRAIEHQRAADAVAEHHERVALVEERLAELDEQHSDLTAEVAFIQSQHAAFTKSQARAAAELKTIEAKLSAIEQSLAGITERATQLEERRSDHERKTIATRVEVAKSEERLTNYQTQFRQLQRDQQERQRVIEDSRLQLASCQQRIEQSMMSILTAESISAELYLRKETFAAQATELTAQRASHVSAKNRLASQIQALRSTSRKLEEQLHRQELTANEVRHERKAMSDRLRDDYGIEVADLSAPTPGEAQARDAVDQEIEDLRRKIHHMGSVNIEALDELDQLEARYNALAAQYKDLSDAKSALAQIINKINADSRRLFAETLDVVREHFQTLFRKLFGGGQADIVLEEGVDILDSGIEIMARPPGKEPRSISLLSGGEKTLTCVALLLSIFRSRPSPFCVLDEVDAALDEANIERFATVLQEFLNWTQFIVITHSKKTMTSANTLYGVTMQESGISKQVSVRFDDISDTGEFRWSDSKAQAEQDEGDIQAA